MFFKKKEPKVLNTINLSRDLDYHTQTNNKIKPIETCNPTSAIMALKARGITYQVPEGMQDEDYLTQICESEEAYKIMREKYPWALRGGFAPFQVHGLLEWAIEKLVGKKVSTFSTDWGLDELMLFLLDGIPSTISTNFTSYGHMVALMGFETFQDINEIRDTGKIDFKKVKSFIVDDPYGKYYSEYQDRHGNDNRISYEDFIKLVKAPNKYKKWAHVFVG